MSLPLTPPLLRQALELENFDSFAAQSIMAPLQRPTKRPATKSGQAKLAAVLALIYPHLEEWHLVMIQRNSYPGVHSNQIGLPGGRQEAGETFLQTALRETEEEIGVPATEIEVLGRLTPIYIPPSDYEVHPFVGHITHRPNFIPQEREVSGIIEAPLHLLLREDLKLVDTVDVRGMRFQAPYYHLMGHKVWGATAIILAELEGRLRQVLPPGIA